MLNMWPMSLPPPYHRQKSRLRRRKTTGCRGGDGGDAKEEADLDPRKWQGADTQDSQLKRAVRRANTHVQRVCDATYPRLFLETRWGSGGGVAPA